MSKQDYYELLGVTKSANADELKKAYRKMAMQYHPDKNPGNKEAEQKFKDLSEAYDVLKDDNKRAAYDRYGHAAFEQGAGGFGGGGGFGFGGFDFNFGGMGGMSDIFEEVFGDFMGGGRSGRSKAYSEHTGQRGADLRYNMTIDLEEAFTGASKIIDIPTSIQCEKCHGHGTKDGKQPPICDTCGGHGKVRMQQGFFTIERPCPVCGGFGRAIKEKCPDCHGAGRIEKKKKLEIKIPKGVESGNRIRLNREGEAGLRGGEAGDLYIFLEVKDHQLFRREGANLYFSIPISMSTAILGGDVEIPGIDGSKETLTVDTGTQTGHQFRLKNKGMSILDSEKRGDLFVKVRVETPVNLTKRQKELIKEFVAEGKEFSPESDSFLAKLKDFLK